MPGFLAFTRESVFAFFGVIAMLQLDAISKSFATPVLQAINLTLQAGQIVGLLGANGAGKSTLSRIIAGLLPLDSGRMNLDGQPYSPASKSDAESLGVQIVQQELNLVSTLSVEENLFLNRLPHRFGVISRSQLRTLATAALRQMNLHEIPPDAIVGDLGVGKQQLVEIASALSRPCRVLILDEPTAALTDNETQLLFDRLKNFRTQGTAILYISHRLNEVQRVSDRTIVLRDGKLVADHPVSEFNQDAVVKLMSGDRQVAGTETNVDQEETVASAAPRNCDSKLALRIRNLRRPPLLKAVTLDVLKGECLGIAGLVGSGRTELLRCIFGADLATDGYIQFPASETRMRFDHPKFATQAGIALVTEDRRNDGLLLTQSIRSNSTLGILDRISRGWNRLQATRVVDAGAEVAAAQRVSRDLHVQCRDMEQSVGELSGGNQQKIVLGRWLLKEPDILLLDEPTRGIDVSSRSRIYQTLKELKSAGKALVMVSSDTDELLHICDRIVVMSGGRISAVFNKKQFDADLIMRASFAEYTEAPPNQAETGETNETV